MAIELANTKLLGINGAGRIGKLLLWNELRARRFDGFVVNFGRAVGGGLDDLLESLLHDSTYGSLERFLLGVDGKISARVIDAAEGLIEIHGRSLRVLRDQRNPSLIEWRKWGVPIVVDATGAFNDPNAESAKGSLRGHLDAGAKIVVNSAPFKSKDKRKLPDDACVLVYGINHTNFDPARHKVVSAASCTTTALAHMMKPLLDTEVTSRILTASMSTIHAATNSQGVLDSVPGAGATDLRKNRAALNNIILTATGAARALEEVLPAIRHIGFLADSVRVPTTTVSLVNLNLTFHSSVGPDGEPTVTRAVINDIYRRAAAEAHKDLLVYTDRQSVSADLIGKKASVVIEGHETHTRLGFLHLPPEALGNAGSSAPSDLRIPVSHAKVFGWYDNEFGSYVYSLGELVGYLARSLV